jgi:glycosyltransferase involved in cell wall biosynthesis
MEQRSTRIPLSAVVLTLNEERNIEECLASIAELGTEVFVVDSGSADSTVEIATRLGAKVVTHPFEGHAKQWNWALRNLPIQTEWILALDADHRVTPELRASMTNVLQDGASVGIDGYYVCRRQVFRGKWIRHGGYYPKHLLKLLRRGKASCDDSELLDFRFYVPGTTAPLAGDLIEDNHNEDRIAFWIAKHNHFSDLQAAEELRRRRTRETWTVEPAFFGSPDQRTLWFKERWYRMPLGFRPFAYFFYRYFLRLGFLDGWQGFVFHFLQGFWYRLIVDLKMRELMDQERQEGS